MAYCANSKPTFHHIVPWGKKHKAAEDPEDEAYAADVERQMQTERKREQRWSPTQLQPQALPNPYDRAEVKGRECCLIPTAWKRLRSLS